MLKELERDHAIDCFCPLYADAEKENGTYVPTVGLALVMLWCCPHSEVCRLDIFLFSRMIIS